MRGSIDIREVCQVAEACSNMASRDLHYIAEDLKKTGSFNELHMKRFDFYMSIVRHCDYLIGQYLSTLEDSETIN